MEEQPDVLMRHVWLYGAGVDSRLAGPPSMRQEAADIAIWTNRRYSNVRMAVESGERAMASSKTSVGNARATEERYRASLRDVVMEHLGTTPEKAAWCEAELDVLWEYGELSPFEMAVNAWNSGNPKLYEHALADDARLTALAEKARASG